MVKYDDATIIILYSINKKFVEKKDNAVII